MSDVIEILTPATPEVVEVIQQGPQGSTIADANAPATNNILWQIRTSAFTAVSGGRYVCNGTFTVTNPASGNDGELFQVVVASGTVTVNGVAYGASRWPVTVARISGAWTTLANTLTENLTLNGTNSTAPNQSASSDSSLMTRALGDARYFLNNAILTDFYDIPLANSNGANSGLNAFSIASNQGFTSTFTGGAAPAANSYAVWSNNYSGATQSSSSVFCGAGFGLTAIIQSPARDDCFTRLIVGGLSANTDRTLGTLTAKGFGIETDRSLAGTGNTAFRMRLIYNDGTTTHVGSWSLNQSSAKFRVWFINTGTQIIGYFVGIDTNVLPPKTFTALPFINTTVGDNFLTSSSLHQTFQVVTAGGTAASIYAEIQRVKQTYNFFPA
jgi:hypothetical protein